ncbi:hypothetical protein C0993_012068 [Termitomyces sp. T159_Od127]|nr:hypothetical protein C0993_012068 [Termitomyces sp. T159_Od127]
MGYAPFELNNGYMPSMIKELHTDKVIHHGIKDFAQNALMNLASTHDAFIKACVFQMHHANKCQSNEPAIEKGDLVYLFTKNLNLPKGWASKLCSKWVGPYKVLEAEPTTLNYVLELPTALQAWQIVPKLHVLLLRPYLANNDMLFLNHATLEPYDLSTANSQEWFVDDLIDHCFSQNAVVAYSGPKEPLLYEMPLHAQMEVDKEERCYECQFVDMHHEHYYQPVLSLWQTSVTIYACAVALAVMREVALQVQYEMGTEVLLQRLEAARQPMPPTVLFLQDNLAVMVMKGLLNQIKLMQRQCILVLEQIDHAMKCELSSPEEMVSKLKWARQQLLRPMDVARAGATTSWVGL